MAGESLSFLRLPAPTEGEVQDVAAQTAKRVVAILKKRVARSKALSGDEEGGDIAPALAACYDVAARPPALRVVDPSRIRDDERVAVVTGFNVHAGAALERVAVRMKRLATLRARVIPRKAVSGTS
jgi:hypothetical protein